MLGEKRKDEEAVTGKSCFLSICMIIGIPLLIIGLLYAGCLAYFENVL